MRLGVDVWRADALGSFGDRSFFEMAAAFGQMADASNLSDNSACNEVFLPSTGENSEKYVPETKKIP